MDISLIALLLIGAGAAFTQGFSGFGFGITFMAMLSLAGRDMERASVFVSITVIMIVVTLPTGLLITLPLGYRFILNYGDMPVSQIVLGVVLMLFAFNRMRKPHVKRHIPSLLAPVFGMCSGLLSGAFSSGGPPVVMYLYSQEDDPRMAVGTAQAVFLGAGIYRLAVVMAGERGISEQLLVQSLLVAPVIIAATIIGARAARKFSVRPFLLTVYGLILFAGLLNIVRGLKNYFAV
ncbi:MAG: sulfite exporter TauE/SafE family protein [Lentisphaerae bacterium]|nr:sulfite exporter TauE/SafE family protein [Lentisphaerota bacterium]